MWRKGKFWGASQVALPGMLNVRFYGESFGKRGHEVSGFGSVTWEGYPLFHAQRLLLLVILLLSPCFVEAFAPREVGVFGVSIGAGWGAVGAPVGIRWKPGSPSARDPGHPHLDPYPDLTRDFGLVAVGRSVRNGAPTSRPVIFTSKGVARKGRYALESSQPMPPDRA